MRLFGCLGGADNRVQQEPDVKKPYLGPRGYEKTIHSGRSVDLHAYFWPPSGAPRGVVQLLHGSNTYIEFDFLKFEAAGQPHRYEGSWVEELNRRGYAVCGLDFQGFGRSKGHGALLKRFEDCVDDALLFALHLRRGGEGTLSLEGTPHFLLGFDLGGLVAVAASLRQPGWFTGMLLVSPLLVLPLRTREANRWWIRLLSVLAPRAGVGPSAAEDMPEKWMREAYEQDPLVHHGPTPARTLEELLTATERLASEEGDPPGRCLGCVTVPLLVLQAAGDTVSEPAGARLLLERAATYDKQLRSIDAGQHALMQDECNSVRLLEEAVSWLDEQCCTSRTRGLFPRAPAESAVGSMVSSPDRAPKPDAGKGLLGEEGQPAEQERREQVAAVGTSSAADQTGGSDRTDLLPGMVCATSGGDEDARVQPRAASQRSRRSSVQSTRSDLRAAGRGTDPPYDGSGGGDFGDAEPQDCAGGDGGRDGGAMGAARPGDDNEGSPASGSHRSQQGAGPLSPRPKRRNPSQRSRGSFSESEAAQEVASNQAMVEDGRSGDGDGGTSEEEQSVCSPAPPSQQQQQQPPSSESDSRPRAHMSRRLPALGSREGDWSSGAFGLKEAVGDIDFEGRSLPDREAALRFGDHGLGGGSKGFFLSYGSRKALHQAREDSGDNEVDPDPFAPQPPSPRPYLKRPLPLQPPSSLPPLGPSRFAPLPPIKFGAS